MKYCQSKSFKSFLIFTQLLVLGKEFQNEFTHYFIKIQRNLNYVLFPKINQENLEKQNKTVRDCKSFRLVTIWSKDFLEMTHFILIHIKFLVENLELITIIGAILAREPLLIIFIQNLFNTTDLYKINERYFIEPC